MIPITEDELTDFLRGKVVPGEYYNQQLSEVRRLARLMLASEQMYAGIKKFETAMTDFADDIHIEAKGFPAQITIGDAIELFKAALAAAEGRK